MGDFLQVLALPRATPAGGSACAHVGAVGFALFLKVLRLEAKRSTATSDLRPDWEGFLDIAQRLLDAMQKFISEDADSYDAYRKVLKDGALPGHVNDAVARMTECPLQIIETAVEGIIAINVVSAICSQHLKPDLAVCCELLTACWHGARHIVEANLPLMPDQERRLRIERRLHTFLTAASQTGNCHGSLPV